MIAGSALGSRALSDTTRRNLASEWGGPDPAAVRRAGQNLNPARERGRRVTMRKP
ncbi:MAG: hypothetical protein Q7T68_19390 [Sphingopyxis sp.]|nr:hypothetical protein [Sphingopyxis sp.]